MSVRRGLGIDGIELSIHAALTVCVMGFVIGTGGPEVFAGFVVPGVSLALLAIRRRLAFRRGGLETTGEAAAAHVAELEHRVADLEAGQDRILELEERLDFAERLLARHRDPAALERGER